MIIALDNNVTCGNHSLIATATPREAPVQRKISFKWRQDRDINALSAKHSVKEEIVVCLHRNSFKSKSDFVLASDNGMWLIGDLCEKQGHHRSQNEMRIGI